MGNATTWQDGPNVNTSILTRKGSVWFDRVGLYECKLYGEEMSKEGNLSNVGL